VHELHTHAPTHDCAPLFWQDSVEPSAQTPSPVHADQVDHCPVAESHVRVCVPQLPHACEAGPLHVWLVHCPHWQLPPHDCVPPLAQDCVELGAQTPAFVQADHWDHVPVASSHVRVCVPQLPHDCVVGPVGQFLGPASFMRPASCPEASRPLSTAASVSMPESGVAASTVMMMFSSSASAPESPTVSCVELLPPQPTAAAARRVTRTRSRLAPVLAAVAEYRRGLFVVFMPPNRPCAVRVVCPQSICLSVAATGSATR
jgi:hypothetical protein